MTALSLVDRLAAHRTLGGAPREQLEWLARRGELRHFEPGDVVTPHNSQVRGVFVLLDGSMSIHVDRGTGSRRVMGWKAGDVSGVLPYSRLTTSPGEVKAEEPMEMLLLPREHLPDLIRECHDVTAILVHVMLDRARQFTSSDLHDEKMLSLGKLAAGLAHELNNPASAAARSAEALAGALSFSDAASRALGAAGLSPAQLLTIERLRTGDGASARPDERPPLERADREDAFTEWLAQHGLDDQHAGSFAESAMTVAALEELADALDGPALDVAVRYLVAEHVARKLADEIRTAVQRIHSLVGAVKRFSYMDRAPALGPVQLGDGLADTLVMLRAKARLKGVSLALEVEADLPPVMGFGDELNQVWTNLIDNALDAAPSSGHVSVVVSRAGDNVVVSVVDDGPGIPDGVKERIFDPFFTTKPVGEGTGLGLDIVSRLVRRHRGEIDVESQPGRTQFRVSLPISHAAGS